MRDKILEIISTQFNIDVENLNDDMSFIDDLNADSIEIVEFIMSLEDEFGIEIDEDVVESIATIGDVIEYIEELE